MVLESLLAMLVVIVGHGHDRFGRPGAAVVAAASETGSTNNDRGMRASQFCLHTVGRYGDPKRTSVSVRERVKQPTPTYDATVAVPPRDTIA